MNRKELAAVAGATLLISLPAFACVNHSRLEGALQDIQPIEIEEEVVAETPPDVEPVEETEVKEEVAPPVEELEPTIKEEYWVGRNFNAKETEVLKFLQERGIKDRAALAVILGNIKQESRFNNIVCEGGKMTGYANCHRGGFGLIQWTTTGRYDGLGRFSSKYGLDPNSMTAQLRYMTNEREWIEVEYIWKTPGKSIDEYMKAAYHWLGWGIHGKRTLYSQQYYNQLYLG